MARTVSANLKAHLALETTTLATLWVITRTDGTIFRFTDHDQDLEFESNTYTSEHGYDRTAVKNTATFSTDELDLTGFFNSSSIIQADVRNGLFDFAEVLIMVVNYNSLGDGDMILRRGNMGEVESSPSGKFKVELRGLTQRLTNKFGEKYQAECRADLGDARCTMPIQPAVIVRNTAYAVGDFVRVDTAGGGDQTAYENRIYECTVAGTTHASVQPTFDTTVTNTTVDGTATFKAYEAWTRDAVVASVTDQQIFAITVSESRAADDWYNGGAVYWESGLNSGVAMEIKDWDRTGGDEVTLYLPMAQEVAVADKLTIYPGCDKMWATCIARFAMSGSVNFDGGNYLNFRGEPFLPGRDQIARYPDRK